MTCQVCGDPEVYARGRCRACYRFALAKGRDRRPREVQLLLLRRERIVSGRYERLVMAEELKVLVTTAESHA